MPTYEFACTECKHEWEEIQRIVDPPLDTCPACGKKTAKKLISKTSFSLKGGGWYAEGYAGPAPAAASPTPTPASNVSDSAMAAAATCPTTTAVAKS